LHDGEAVLDNYPDRGLMLEGVTHIIAANIDFPDYEAASDAMIPTVKPVWVQQSLARNKMANPKQHTPDDRMIMSDVVACCVDLPEGDADAIAGGIIALGGLFTSKLTSQVTHIITLTVDSEQVETVSKKGLRVKIVLPHWFDDCLRVGKKIDEHPYTLPDPEIFRSGLQKLPIGNAKDLTGATDPDPSAAPPPTPPADSRRDQHIFKNKKVFLGRDLGIGSHLRGILEGIIRGSGGKIVNTVNTCDMYIGKYRQGSDYIQTSRAGKHVGNLAWLYYLITNDKWTSPLKRLLHYPVAQDPVPGFQGLKISLSNYTGEARIYLENLIVAAGAECTKTLKQDNSHLITAHIESEKCAAAKDWGIELVNHLWLEESYAKWKMQSVTNSRYTHFPSRTNLSEVVGQTSIDRSVMEANFFPQEDVEMQDVEPGQPKAQKTATKQQNAKTKVPLSSNTAQVEFRTPAASRFIGTGKENITPTTAGSRKSKDAATAKLQALTPDIAMYEKERKRVGGVVYGGRRLNDDDRVQPTRKRSAEHMSDSEDVVDEVDTKKSKKGLPTPFMHLLISSYKKWVDQPKVEDYDRVSRSSKSNLSISNLTPGTITATWHRGNGRTFPSDSCCCPQDRPNHQVRGCPCLLVRRPFHRLHRRMSGA
jgi:hypothetical protein